MKTTMASLKKSLLSVMIAVAPSVCHAQDYMLNYGPGSPAWCWQQQQEINAMAAQTMMMRQQVLNYYSQQAAAATQWLQTNPCAPMPGVVTYDGVYVTPETVNNYHKENVACEHCNGGYNYRSVYVGGGQSRQQKTRCGWCHGKGYVTKTVSNE